jgi:mono/diheme cytochrome c family protein
MPFWLGCLVGIAVCIGGPLLAFRLGLVDMSALPAPGPVERFVGTLAYDRWIERAAPREPNPFDGDPAAIALGLDHYRENCVVCHGAPDLEPAEIAEGLHPDAPRLWKESQKLTDGELFWTIRQGVRMTGMPAFAPTHSDEDIWKIVAFLHHLPHLTPEETAELRAPSREDEHHHRPAG